MRYVLPTFCHFGEAFSAYTRGRKDDVRRQLDVIAEANYHGIRFWDVLGYYARAWKHREVTPIAFRNNEGELVDATPGYYQLLEEFLFACQTRGLAVHHSRGDLNAWSTAQVIDHCLFVGEVQRRAGLPIIGLNESVNECDLNIVDYSPDFLRQMLKAIGNPETIGALSTPPGQTEEGPDLERYQHDVWYVHPDRGGDADPNRMLRHCFTNGYEVSRSTGKPGWSGEPSGPGSGVTGGQTNNPETLCLMAAIHLITKQAFVYMSSHGVFWNGPIDRQPGFWEVPKVRQYLPREIMTGHITHGGKPESAFTSPTGFYGDPGVSEGPARIDGAELPDGRGAWVIHSGAGRRKALARRGFEGRIVNPATAFEQAIRLEPGQSVEIPYDIGRLLVGRTLRAA